MSEQTYKDVITGRVLTMPTPDTRPGPGNIQFRVDSLEDWQERFLVEDPQAHEVELGSGTARDTGSTDNLPD